MDALTGISSVAQGIDLSFDTSARQGGEKARVNAIRQTSGRERGEFDEDLRIGSRQDSHSLEKARNASGESGAPPKDTDATGLRLTPEKREEVEELKRRDREVRTHEQAHVAASGGVSVSGPTYSLQKGPDGRMYAVGGEVQIDTSEGKTPDETITRAKQIRAAANAPAQPSGQDKAVAAQASRMEADARKEKAQEARSESGNAGQPGQPSASGTTAQATAVAGGEAVAQSRETAESSDSGHAATHAGTYSAREAARGRNAYAQETARLDADRLATPTQGSAPGSAQAEPTGHAGHSNHSAMASAMNGLDSLRAAASGRTSGYLGGTDRAPDSGPEAMRRAADAYQRHVPGNGPAPAGTGISRAV